MRPAVLILAGAALALLARPARADDMPADVPDGTGPGWSGGLAAEPGQLPTFGDFDLTPWATTEPTGYAVASTSTGAEQFRMWEIMDRNAEREPIMQAAEAPDTGGDNLRAFLSAIAWAEGTDREPDPYRVCYGYRHTIRDLSEHPAESGEWRGEPLDNLGPAYRGKVSTAAGRYQIIRPTWRRCRAALGLRDFGAVSQDAAAVWLIQQRGALGLVQAGQIEAAARLCAPEWASLPGSTAGQPQRRMAALIDTYTNAGGYLA